MNAGMRAVLEVGFPVFPRFPFWGQDVPCASLVPFVPAFNMRGGLTLLLKWVQPLDPCHLNSKVNKSGGWLGDLLGFPTQSPARYLQHVCLARLKRYTYLYPKTGINQKASIGSVYVPVTLLY
jgi:hypothetical protein